MLGSSDMPGADWFPGAMVNYAQHLFGAKAPGEVAIRHASETRAAGEWTWGELSDEASRIAAALVQLGVGPGDRVAAVLPNVPETVAAFLATASIGAIWTLAAPEFGPGAILDRFAQVEPAVLLAVDGYRYGQKDFDCEDRMAAVARGLPGTRVIRFGYLNGRGWEAGFADTPAQGLSFTRVPFSHPLWILYSSGTTGLPKAIVHSHGGVLLEQLKTGHLHLDCRAGDRFFWFTTTGWMMWNLVVGVLLTDSSIVLYDGSPLGEALWDLAETMAVTTFGVSAAFVTAAMKAGSEPKRPRRRLASVRAVGSTGSPLSPEGFTWIYDKLGPDVWLFSPSGGTDVVTPFVGGVPTLPVYRGELQAPALGVSLESWDADGRSIRDAVGELVVTKPMPSMPLYFWNDPQGARLRETYFDRFPGVWRHGDWIEITSRNTAVLHGRSDATINRGGVRIGTSEIYRAVLAEDAVVDALVVDVPEGASGEGWLPLFVVLQGRRLDAEYAARLKERIRSECSPRHVPSHVYEVAEIPRTLSGKILEVPVKRILMGAEPEDVVSRGSLANPVALDFFAELARSPRR